MVQVNNCKVKDDVKVEIYNRIDKEFEILYGNYNISMGVKNVQENYQ